MAISATKKAYRLTPEEREKRRLYALEWRKRPEVMERDRLRAQKIRKTSEGAQINRDRVKNNRIKLGREYITSLLHDATGVPRKNIPDELVDMKRQAIEIRRISKNLLSAAITQRTNDETST